MTTMTIKGNVTERDLKVIDFLENYNIATTTTLEHFIYEDKKRVAQRRLKILNDNKIINRSKKIDNQDYCYFIKKPKQYKHSLLITEFYREFNKLYKVEIFNIQKKIDNIIPDATIGYYNKDGLQRIAFLEVEISNKGFDYNKYYLTCKKMKRDTGFNPYIFVVTKHGLKKKDDLQFVKINYENLDIAKDLNKFYKSE